MQTQVKSEKEIKIDRVWHILKAITWKSNRWFDYRRIRTSYKNGIILSA